MQKESPMFLEKAQEKRQNALKNAAEGVYDVAIIGGGIQGLSLCREATLAGYKVLLLEAVDFAFGTSSRSSKMLHGGLRYLAQGDIALVHEALLERGVTINSAPHLARPQEFLVPVVPGLSEPAWMLRIGLTMYDILAKSFSGNVSARFPWHRKLSAKEPISRSLKELGVKFSGLFSYYDGQMDDSRIAAEHALDCVQLGATVINHTKVTAAEKVSDGSASWQLSWHDQLNGTKGKSKARFVVNAAGPWVPEVQQQLGAWKGEWPTPVFSRGIHLLFNKPWNLPGLTLATGEKGRVYFVWPYFSAIGGCTLVGTTDQKVDANESDPVPNEKEIEEVLSFLARDIPHAGLNRDCLYASFCGMRILGATQTRANAAGKFSSKLSRAENTLEFENGFSILGGKYTGARHVGEKLLRKINKHFGNSQRPAASKTRPLPGGAGYSDSAVNALRKDLADQIVKNSPSVDAEQAARHARVATNRFGMRARELLSAELAPHCVPLIDQVSALRAEVHLAVMTEQASTVEDLMRRRLGLRLEAVPHAALEKAINDELGALRKVSNQQ